MQSHERSLLGPHGGPAGGGGMWWRSVRGARAHACRRLRAAGAGGVGRAALLAGGCGGLAACGAVASMSLESQQPPKPPRQRGAMDFGSPLRRCTDVLLVTNAVLFAAQWLSRDALTLWGAKVNSLIAAGQVWRLLTSSLLHTGLFHLLINSHALHTIGPHLEMVGGRGRFVSVYVAGALAGTTASFLLTPAPSVGASSALFALGAALGVFYHRHRDALGERSDYVLRQLGITLAINLAYSMANKRVDNWGHIGGMVGGAIVAWALGPRLVRDPSTGRVADSPPVPVFANGPGSGLGALMVARSSEGGRKQGGKEAGGGGKKKQQAEERQ